MAGTAQQHAPFTVGRGNDVILLDDSTADLVLTRIFYEQSGALNLLVLFSAPSELLSHLDDRKDRGQAQPELILLDINMPELNGFEVLARLKRDPYYAAVPLVFMLTNSANPDDVDRATQLGAADYFVKPSTVEDFVDIIHQLRDRLGGHE